MKSFLQSCCAISAFSQNISVLPKQTNRLPLHLSIKKFDHYRNEKST
jgi:hypothetical protein